MAEDPIFYAWQHDDLEALADLAKSYRDGRDDLRAHSDEVLRQLRVAESDRDRFRAELADAHNVIRRYRAGWVPVPRVDLWENEHGDMWDMTPAEAAVIRAATADPTPHTETRRIDPHEGMTP